MPRERRNLQQERWADMATVARIYEQMGEPVPAGTLAPFVTDAACHCDHPDHVYKGSESVFGAPVHLPTESIEDWQCVNCGATWTYSRDLTKPHDDRIDEALWAVRLASPDVAEDTEC